MVPILHEDPHLLVVNKPAGLLTQGRVGGEPSLETRVRAYLAPDDPASVYLGTVHRLDRPVSGVVLWAKTAKAARRLADQFSKREARKEYRAIVAGRPTADRGGWEDWLCEEDTGLGRVQVCLAGTPRARRAFTRFELDPGPDRTLPEGTSGLRLFPETGRTHQLRVQAASRGMPILGDSLYGSDRAFPEGIALHARSLEIAHPISDLRMTFRAPLPEAWDAPWWS